MQPHTYFISDLHLTSTLPHITTAFFDFLTNKASHADQLYILGDFFEAWIGDDDETPYHQSIIKSLHQLSTQTPIYFIHGNRDFLLGQRFATAANMTLLKDPSTVTLYGKKIVLTHGDFLCTDDTRHQYFRKITANKLLQKLFFFYYHCQRDAKWPTLCVKPANLILIMLPCLFVMLILLQQ